MTRNIHSTAHIGGAVQIEENVMVGPFTVIEGRTTIGAGTVIGSHCVLGVQSGLAESDELVIGASSLIRSHSIFYAGSRFGAGLITGHRATVRENTKAGKNLQIGTLCDIQGHCSFGDYVRLHSNVHIGHLSSIGDFVWIFPYVVLTNDPHPPSESHVGCKIGSFAAVATMSVVLPGVSVGLGALVGAMTLVRDDVPDDMICVGNPGKVVGPTSRIKLRGTDQPAYPWRRHFHRGYPEDVVSAWKAEFSGEQAC